MAKESAIAAPDHGPGIAQKGHYGVAHRGRLPVISAEAANAKDDLRDFLLGRAVACAVPGLQHATRPCALLAGQARVRRNGAAMQRGEKSVDGFQTIEPSDAKRNESGKRQAVRPDLQTQQLDALTIAEVAESMSALLVPMKDRIDGERVVFTAASQNSGGGRQHDHAGIVLRQPEDRSGRRGAQRVHREIATPTAGASRPSAAVDRDQIVLAPRNPHHRRRCGEAIPMRDRMPSGLRHGHSFPKSPIETHLASSRSSPVRLRVAGGGHDSRISCLSEASLEATGDALPASRR